LGRPCVAEDLADWAAFAAEVERRVGPMKMNEQFARFFEIWARGRKSAAPAPGPGDPADKRRDDGLRDVFGG